MSDMEQLRKLLLVAVLEFLTKDEEIWRERFTRLDSPNILPGEQVIVTIRREHKWTEVEPPVILVENLVKYG
jgi:hypothetical protein